MDDIKKIIKDEIWDVAVIIPTLDRHQYLLKTIEYFYKQSVLPKEIVVIDQSPIKEINIEKLNDFDQHINLNYFHLDTCSKKCALNWGLRLTKSPIVLIVDDDVEFDENLVYNHLCALIEHNVDNINGASIKPNGKLLSEPRKPSFWEDGVFQLTHNRMVDYPCMTLQVNGNNSSFKREILIKVNGWDENSLIASDDDEMSMKLFNYGGKMLYDPRPRLYHLKAAKGGWRSIWRKKIFTSFFKRLLESPHPRYIYYYRKHFSTYATICYIILVIVRGPYNYEIKKIRSFIKTPVRILAAIINWRRTTKMLNVDEHGYAQATPSKIKKLFSTIA